MAALFFCGNVENFVFLSGESDVFFPEINGQFLVHAF